MTEPSLHKSRTISVVPPLSAHTQPWDQDAWDKPWPCHLLAMGSKHPYLSAPQFVHLRNGAVTILYVV